MRDDVRIPKSASSTSFKHHSSIAAVAIPIGGQLTPQEITDSAFECLSDLFAYIWLYSVNGPPAIVIPTPNWVSVKTTSVFVLSVSCKTLPRRTSWIVRKNCWHDGVCPCTEDQVNA